MKCINDLVKELSSVGLCVVDRNDGSFSVGARAFANPLLLFNPSKEYSGSVIVKSINARLFTPEQISTALQLVDKFLNQS